MDGFSPVGAAGDLSGEAVSVTIAETCDEGFGDVDVHEVETDDTRNLAHFAWYAGGSASPVFGRMLSRAQTGTS